MCVPYVMGASCTGLILGRCRVSNHTSIQTRRIVDAEDKSGKSGALLFARPSASRPTARANLSLRSPSAAVTTRGDLRRAEVEHACFGRSHCVHTAVHGAPAEAAVSAAPTT